MLREGSIGSVFVSNLMRFLEVKSYHVMIFIDVYVCMFGLYFRYFFSSVGCAIHLS